MDTNNTANIALITQADAFLMDPTSLTDRQALDLVFALCNAATAVCTDRNEYAKLSMRVHMIRCAFPAILDYAWAYEDLQRRCRLRPLGPRR